MSMLLRLVDVPEDTGHELWADPDTIRPFFTDLFDGAFDDLHTDDPRQIKQLDIGKAWAGLHYVLTGTNVFAGADEEPSDEDEEEDYEDEEEDYEDEEEDYEDEEEDYEDEDEEPAGPLDFLLLGGRDLEIDLGYGNVRWLSAADVATAAKHIDELADATVDQRVADVTGNVEPVAYPVSGLNESDQNWLRALFNELKTFVTDVAANERALLIFLH